MLNLLDKTSLKEVESMHRDLISIKKIPIELAKSNFNEDTMIWLENDFDVIKKIIYYLKNHILNSRPYKGRRIVNIAINLLFKLRKDSY